MEKEQETNNSDIVIEKKPKKTKKASQTEKLNPLVNYQYDLDSHEWLDKKLQPREKLFVYYYCVTNGANLAECARLAGYSKNTASVIGCQKKIALKKEIENFQKNLIKLNIFDAYNQIIQLQKKAAFFDPTEIYEDREITLYKDITEEKKLPKRFDEIPEETRRIIKGVKADGSLELIDKGKAQEFLVKLYNEMNAEKNTDGMEIETTAEIIKGNLQLKTKIIQNNQKISDSTDYVKEARATGNTDLESLEED